MKAVLCDICKEIIEDEQIVDYHKKTDEFSIEIGLAGEKDMCHECSRKLFARAASAAWDELKSTRKSKEKKDGNKKTEMHMPA